MNNIAYPFEFHLTIKTNELDRFRNFCKLINVKPIILELQNNKNNEIYQDVMTSSFITTTTNKIREELNELILCFENNNFDVIRSKIETVTYHPIGKDITYDSNIYFEAHFKINLNNIDLNLLKNKCNEIGIHLSKNILNNETIMATYRNYESLESFNDYINYIIFQMNNFDLKLSASELSIYDSNLKHDDNWINLCEKCGKCYE